MNSKRANVVDSLVAERIRAYRKQSGLSQSDLGKKLGVTFQQIQKYEKGTNRVGAGRLFEIAGIFGIPVQALYPESGEADERAKYRTDESKEISRFVMSADGWRLCRSFLRIVDHQKRKKIIALIQEIAGR